MIKTGKAGALLYHRKALSDLPVRIIGDLMLSPSDHLSTFIESFTESAGADRNDNTFPSFSQASEDLKHIALLHDILPGHLQRIYTELHRELSHGRDYREVSLRCSVALVGTGRRRIGVIREEIVVHIIDAEDRERLGRCIHRDCKTMVAIWPGICPYIHIDCSDCPILLSAHLHTDSHRMARGVGEELLSSGIPVVYGLAGLPDCVSYKILYEDILLGAITTSYPFLDDMDLMLRNLAHSRHNAPYMERNLGRAVQGKPSTLYMPIAYMGLKRSALHLACLIGLIDDCIGFSETLLDIPYSAMGCSRDILPYIAMERELVNDLLLIGISALIVLIKIIGCTGYILDNSVMNQGCAIGHSLFYCKDRLDRIIYHLDKRCSLLCCLHILCNDSCDSIADMADLAVQQPSVIWRRLRISLPCLHVVDIGAVECRDNILDTINLHCLREID